MSRKNITEKATKKQLLDVYLSQLSEVRERYKEAEKTNVQHSRVFNKYRGLFAKILSYEDKRGVWHEVKNKRGIAQGKLSNINKTQLQALIRLQREFLNNPLTTEKGRQERYEKWKENYIKSRPQAKATTQELYNLKSEEYDKLIDIVGSEKMQNVFDRVTESLETDIIEDIKERSVVSSTMIIDAIKQGYTDNDIDNAIFEITREVALIEHRTRVQLSNEKIEELWWSVLEKLRTH